MTVEQLIEVLKLLPKQEEVFLGEELQHLTYLGKIVTKVVSQEGKTYLLNTNK